MFSHSRKTRWLRTANFWQTANNRSVMFMSDGAIVFRISFREKHGIIYVELLVSEFYLPKIKHYFKQSLAGTRGLQFYHNAIEFKLGFNTAERLINIFKKINREYFCQEFSEPLLNEIEQIGNYRNGWVAARKHRIKKHDFQQQWLVNPNRSSSLQLINLFEKASSQRLVEVRKIKESFKDGENPHQCDTRGHTPLDVLFIRNDLSEKEFKWGISWLLAYKWTPTRISWGQYSPLEKHARFNPGKMQWFEEVIGLQITKPVRAAAMQMESFATSGTVLTSIVSENKIVNTVLKKTSALEKEYPALFALYAATFEVAADENDGSTLTDIFRQDLSGENKHIEIIYADEKIIGFNLYEIMTIPGYPNHLVLHCVDSVIYPDYRRGGLITLLVFRMALLLQMLYPEKIVSMFCVAIHANSGTLFNNLNMLYHPQYGDHDEFVQAILARIENKKTSYFRDNVECHIPQRVRVKEQDLVQAPARESYLKAFFTNEMLGGKNDHQAKGVPMVLFMGFQTYKLLCEFYRHNFNLSDHLRSFAAEVLRSGYQLHEASMNKGRPVALRDVVRLFWCNENITTRHVVTFKPTTERVQCGL